VDIYAVCPLGCYVTNFTGKDLSCRQCPAGKYTNVFGAASCCTCKVFQFQENVGRTTCEPCPRPASLNFGATSCASDAAASNSSSAFYYFLVAWFSCVALLALVVTIRLVRSYRSSSLRTVQLGMCVRVALYVPYAILQAATLGQLATLYKNGFQLDRDATEISARAAFAIFFCMGLLGEVALSQLLRHVVQLHESNGYNSPNALRKTLTSTYKASVLAALAITFGFLVGFGTLSSKYRESITQCALLQDNTCLSSEQSLQQPCSESAAWLLILQYHEAIWVAFVFLVFKLPISLFHGVAFAL
jgi:hypothetical protein